MKLCSSKSPKKKLDKNELQERFGEILKTLKKMFISKVQILYSLTKSIYNSSFENLEFLISTKMNKIDLEERLGETLNIWETLEFFINV